MADTDKTAKILEEVLRIPDPLDTLVTAFNARTDAIEKKITQSDKNYREEIKQIRDSMQSTAKLYSNIMTAVVVVLVIGFITLLFALGAVIVTAMQYGSETYKAQQQADNMSKMREQQEAMNKSLETIKTQTQPKQ